MDTKHYYQPPGASTVLPQEFGETRVFALEGRLGRVRYIAYGVVAGLVTFLPAIVLGGILREAGLTGASTVVIGVGYLAAFAAGIVLAIRRCHDFNTTGWLSLLSLVPLVNLALYLIPGTDGANRFGRRPPPNATGLVLVALFVPALVFVGIAAAVAIPAYDEYTRLAKQAQRESQSGNPAP